MPDGNEKIIKSAEGLPQISSVEREPQIAEAEEVFDLPPTVETKTTEKQELAALEKIRHTNDGNLDSVLLPGSATKLLAVDLKDSKILELNLSLEEKKKYLTDIINNSQTSDFDPFEVNKALLDPKSGN